MILLRTSFWHTCRFPRQCKIKNKPMVYPNSGTDIPVPGMQKNFVQRGPYKVPFYPNRSTLHHGHLFRRVRHGGSNFATPISIVGKGLSVLGAKFSSETCVEARVWYFRLFPALRKIEKRFFNGNSAQLSHRRWCISECSMLLLAVLHCVHGIGMPHWPSHPLQQCFFTVSIPYIPQSWTFTIHKNIARNAKLEYGHARCR